MRQTCGIESEVGRKFYIPNDINSRLLDKSNTFAATPAKLASVNLGLSKGASADGKNFILHMKRLEESSNLEIQSDSKSVGSAQTCRSSSEDHLVEEEREDCIQIESIVLKQQEVNNLAKHIESSSYKMTDVKAAKNINEGEFLSISHTNAD